MLSRCKPLVSNNINNKNRVESLLEHKKEARQEKEEEGEGLLFTEWLLEELQPVEPAYLLNSTTPFSELPKTRQEFDNLYQLGFMDLNDPPMPPLPSMEELKRGYMAPIAITETSRLRSVNGFLSLKGILNAHSTPIFPHFITTPKSPPLVSISSPTGSPQPSTSPRSFSDTPELSTTETSPSSAGSSPLDPWIEEEIEPSIEWQKLEGIKIETKPSSWKAELKFGGLEDLAIEGKEQFCVDQVKVGMMKETHIFLAQAGEYSTTALDRGYTPCSHAILKASQDILNGAAVTPLVILDIENDWRFQNISPCRFFAASPLLSKTSPLEKVLSSLASDSQVPIGLVCLIDDKPREQFSQTDREKLTELAERASVEVDRLEEMQRKNYLRVLKHKRDKWRRDTVKRRSKLSALGSIEEGEALQNFESNDFDDLLENKILTPSPFFNVSCISICPVFHKSATRRAGTKGILEKLPIPELQSLLDMSTRLISETLELEFLYVIKINESLQKIKLISSFNLPIPAPRWDLESHLKFSKSDFSALLYVNSKVTEESNFSTGFILSVPGAGTESYLLGAFSEDRTRVLSADDLAWLRGFARDLKRFLK